MASDDLTEFLISEVRATSLHTRRSMLGSSPTQDSDLFHPNLKSEIREMGGGLSSLNTHFIAIVINSSMPRRRGGLGYRKVQWDETSNSKPQSATVQLFDFGFNLIKHK